MFQGHVNTSLDDKGRLIIPAKFRKHILPEANNTMNITRGRDKCIWLFPSNEWSRVLHALQSTNPYSDEDVELRRQMLFYPDDLTIDSQHRILIPQGALTATGIKKEVLLLGQIERIEIWDPENFESYMKSRPDSYENVMQRVMSKIYSNPSRNE